MAQAGYQGLLPDRIAPDWRGRGAGVKGVFDLAGAFVAFAVLAAVLATGQVLVAVVILTVAMTASLGLGLALIPAPATFAVAVVTDGFGSGTPLRRRALSQMIAARFLFVLGIYAVDFSCSSWLNGSTSMPTPQARPPERSLPR